MSTTASEDSAAAKTNLPTQTISPGEAPTNKGKANSHPHVISPGEGLGSAEKTSQTNGDPVLIGLLVETSLKDYNKECIIIRILIETF